MSYLFVFRAGTDIDHMVPVAWRLLEEGEAVHAVVSPGHDPESDHRIGLLTGYSRFSLHGTWRPPTRGIRRRFPSPGNHLRRTLAFALFTLATRRVRLVAVEWGPGVTAGYDRLASLEGVRAVLRSIGRSLLLRVPRDYRIRHNFVIAARLLRVPTVCLPHGLSIKLDSATSDSLVELLKRGPLDWRDRNRFSAYVLNTDHHRQWHLDYAQGDPSVMQTWGSLRWSPEWFRLNRSLVPDLEWPESADGRLKVVFMVPKWGNRVRAEETIELVKRLHRLDFVSLAMMGHPRPGRGRPDLLRRDPEIAWERLHDVSGASSVAVIGACDVVIDIGSSIGIEVLMQEKVLVNPSYLHELTTLFDVVEGAAVVAQSADEVIEYLRRHASGSPHRPARSAYDELMQHAVYGSRPVPFDVLATYSKRFKELAGDASRSSEATTTATEGS